MIPAVTLADLIQHDAMTGAWQAAGWLVLAAALMIGGVIWDSYRGVNP